MRRRSGPPGSAEKTIKDIRRATHKRHATEEKISIVLEGLRGEYSIAELCRREGIVQSLYSSWSRDFWIERIRLTARNVWLAIPRGRRVRPK